MKERRLSVARRGDDLNALAFPHSLAKPKCLIQNVRQEGRPCVSLISRQFNSGDQYNLMEEAIAYRMVPSDKGKVV